MLRFLFCSSLYIIIYHLFLIINIGYAKEVEIYETPTLLNTYGMPGSIDNPTAEVFPEGQFSVSSSIFGGTIRTNLSFQIALIGIRNWVLYLWLTFFIYIT